MKQLIIENFGFIGGTIFVVVISLLLLLSKYWLNTKWVDVLSPMIGLLVFVGAYNVGKSIFLFLLK